jgi:sugar phosphate isomerase/epimerase
VSLKLSCSDAAFPKLSHDAALRLIVDLDIRAVDLCVFEGYDHITPHTVLANPIAAGADARRQVRGYGLEVADVYAIFGTTPDVLAINHPDADQRIESRKRFEKIVAFAATVESPGVTVLPGIVTPGANEDSLLMAAGELQWRAELAGQNGLQLSFEPHYDSVAPTPDLALELLRKTSGVHVTLDYSHFVFQAIPQPDVDVLIPWTRHIHARQAAPGMMQATAAEGPIDFPRMIRMFNLAGFKGFIALEYTWETWLQCDRVDCISETALLRDVFRAAVTYDVGTARPLRRLRLWRLSSIKEPAWVLYGKSIDSCVVHT